MVNLTVAMANVFMNHGHVTDILIAGTQVLMKLTVVSLMIHVLITIVKKAHIGMAILAMVVTIV
jgi:hypothetical protein